MASARELLDQLRREKSAATPRTWQDRQDLTPYEKQFREEAGLDPTIDRSVLLPISKGRDGIEFAWPEITLDVMESLTLPGHVTKGGEFSPRDVTEMALDISPASVASKGRIMPRNLMQNSAKKTAAAPAKHSQLPKMTRAEKKVMQALQDDSPEGATLMDQMRNLQNPASKRPIVLDGGESVLKLGETAAQFPTAQTYTKAAVKEMMSDAPQKFEAGLRKIISPEFSVREASSALAKQAEDIAAPIYKAAFKKNPALASPRLNKIMQTPAVRQAIKDTATDVQNRMQLMGKPDAELSMVARELAGVDAPDGVAKGLSLRTLNSIKMKMDKKINAGLKSSNAADREAAEAMIDAKNALLNEIDTLDKSKLYAKARKVRSDIYQIEDALNDGLDFFAARGKKAITTEDLAKQFAEYTPQQKQAYKIGMMQDTIARVRSARDSADPTSFMRNESIRGRMKAVLGEDYDKFAKTVEETGKLYQIRNQVLGGSQTTPRAQAVKGFAEDIGGDLVDETGESLVFGPKTVAMRIIFNRARKWFSGLNDKTAREVSEILFSTDPKKRLAFAKKMQNVLESEKASQSAKENAQSALNAFFEADKLIQGGPISGPLWTAKRAPDDATTSNENERPSKARDLLNQLKTESKFTPSSSQSSEMVNDSYGEDWQPNPRMLSGEVEGGDQMLAMYPDSELQRMATPRSAPVPEHIKANEGLSLRAYDDPIKGDKARTVGYGFNMDSGSARKLWKRAGVQADFDAVRRGDEAITPREAEALANSAYMVAYDDALNQFPDLEDYTPARREAILDLSYQLGGPTLSEFKETTAAIKQGKWTTAARHLLKSEYAKQAPDRARKVARALING